MSHVLAPAALALESSLGISAAQLLTWVLIGLFVGSVVGPLFTRRLSGFGTISNLLVGLVGGLLGGFLLDRLRLQFDFGSIRLEYSELFNALVGASVLLIAYFWLKGRSVDARRARSR